MMKRIAAVAAISTVAFQILAGGAGVASAAGRHLGSRPGSTTVTGAASCTVAAGIAVVQDDSGTATIWTDGTYLYCDVTGSAASDFATDPELADITSAIVYSNGDGAIGLEQNDDTGAAGNDRPANFGGLRVTIDVAGDLSFNGSGLNGYYGGTIVLTDTAFSGQGLVGTIYAAASGDYVGGNGPDSFDASAVTADITAVGNAGADTLKSGSGDDSLTGGNGSDKLYAGAGYDTLDCDDSAGTAGNDQCWAGAGDDVVYLGGVTAALGAADVVAPGDGYDNVSNSGTPYAVTYADSTVAVEFDGTDVYTETGDDTLAASGLVSFTGSPKGDELYGFDTLNGGAGADVIVGTAGDDTISGGGGADKIRTAGGDDEVYGDSGADTIKGGSGDDRIYGGGGDDVLYGTGGVDFLKGGTGIDQSWGGAGVDTCSAEVRDSCEFRQG